MAWTRDPDNLIQIMTSNTLPSGVAYASSDESNNAYCAFDNNPGSAWYTFQAPVAPWKLGYDFANGVVVYKYNILPYSSKVDWTPKNWTFEGWNGLSWVVLHTVTNASWSAGVANSYTFANNTKYTKYQLNISATNSGSAPWICELEMIGEPISGDPHSLIPKMTSNTLPSGVAFASSDELHNGYCVFDNSPGSAWYTFQAPYAPWKLGYDFQNGVVVYKYNILIAPTSSTKGYPPKSWTFEGWDGLHWVVLHFVTNETWYSGRLKSYTFANNTKYTKYQLNISAAYDGPPWIYELEMIGDSIPKPHWARDPHNLIPIMMSNTYPSGVAFASSDEDNRAYWAFDSTSGTSWYTFQAPYAPWKLGYDFKNGVVVNKYNILPTGSDIGCTPKNWTFEGWNGLSWVVLHTVTNATWSLGVANSYSFANTTKYTKYQLNISATCNGSPPWIYELEMIGDPIS